MASEAMRRRKVAMICDHILNRRLAAAWYGWLLALKVQRERHHRWRVAARKRNLVLLRRAWFGWNTVRGRR